MNSDRPILVTGARGRIGSAIYRHLKETGRTVHGYSRVAGDGLGLLEDLFVDEVLTRPHVLIHCAWSTVPLVSENHRGIEWKVDLPLLWRVLDTIASGDAAGNSRMVFFSSGGTVYGNAGERASREEDALNPVGWHGFAKVHTERVLMEFQRRCGLPVTLVRLANPYGFESHSAKPQGVIPFLVEAAWQGRRFKVWGDGSARKDYLYVSDLLGAVDAIVDNEIDGPLNVSYGESTSLRELIALVEEAVERKVDLDFGPAPAWDVTDSRLDNSRLRALTSWRPQVDLVAGIARMVDDYRRQA
jgi:UDP-glucose 4-epimerase